MISDQNTTSQDFVRAVCADWFVGGGRGAGVGLIQLRLSDHGLRELMRRLEGDEKNEDVPNGCSSLALLLA